MENNQEIIEKKVAFFGTGAHVVVPIKYIGQTAKIIFSKEKEQVITTE
jgi:putative transposon-encoded protein